MAAGTWLPDATQIASFHEELTTIFAAEDDPISPPGVKYPDLLESAAHRPHTGIGSRDKYNTVLKKTAALFHSIAKNHAFHNGNKRTAIVTLLTTLYRNDRRFCQGINDDDIYDLAVRVADDRFPSETGLAGDKLVDALAKWLDDKTERLNHNFSAMKVSEFLSKCEAAGCLTKLSKDGTHIVQNTGKGSVNISGSTRKISGNVVRNYLRQLRLTSSSSGILQEEFQEGVSGERQEMHRYMAALRRLAKT